MPTNAMQVEAETNARMTIHRIGGLMRGASLGIAALAAIALTPAASQADDVDAERDIARELALGCEAWGMEAGVPDYVCIARLQTDAGETGESHVVPPGAASGAPVLAYACPQERNTLAFEVLERWLSLFDRDLEQEFGIDPYVLAMSKPCVP